MDLSSLIQSYGYGIVLLGVLLEGETVLVLAGFAAHRGYLQLSLVIVAATVGSFLGDQGFFFLGRRYGDRLFPRFPTLESGTARFTQLLNRRSVMVILALRFLYGLRTVGPVAVGMSAVSWQRFLVLNLLGAIVWSAIFACLGYAFGNLAEALLGEVKEVEKWIFATILLIGIAAALLYRSRQHTVSHSL